MIKLKKLIEGEETYPELKKFKHLFSAPTIPESSNIGKWIKFNKWNPDMGLITLLPHKIIHLQKIFDGSLAYRVENQINKFGMPAKLKEVTIISLDEAKKLWIQNIEKVEDKYIEFKENW